MFRRTASLLCLSLAVIGVAQLDGVGNTRSFLYGQSFPTRAAFMEEGQTLTVTTETWPIASGQSVVAVVTTDNFQTTQEYVFAFDGNTSAATKWYGLLGPFPAGSEVKYYLRAQGSGGVTRFDNNGGANFGVYSRWTPRFRPGAILQWFATDYRTMQARLPEVIAAGYSALYLPPPQKSGAGGFSVGFNPFDRFDLGDRLSMGTVRTRYGTHQELRELIREAKRLGLEVYADLVFNHNDNRGSTAINRYPDMIPEDFHIRSSADTGNNEIDFNNAGPFSFGMLNHDLVGLVDVAHENGNNTQSGEFTLPSYASWNPAGKPQFVRHPRVPQFYPDASPVQEDSRQYLRRWAWYLTNVIGFDGYRLDAVKHTPPGFFDFVPNTDQPGSYVSEGDVLPAIYGWNRNAYIFAENYTTGAYELREFTKTGMNMLDFPFKFKAREVFNAGGFGDLRAFTNGWGLDGATGLAYEYGGLTRDNSVSMIQSHDDGPPQSNNLAMATMFARPARPLVYYDGNNLNPFDYNQFPRPGRADALGNFSDATTRLLDARNRFGRGDVVVRWSQQNRVVLERNQGGRGLLLVGLNLRGDIAQTLVVDTGFPAGAVLQDLGGQRPNVTVAGDQKATITIPSNGPDNNGRGYVLYAPVTPVASGEPVTLSGAAGLIPFETISTPAGLHGSPGSYRAMRVSENVVQLDASFDASATSAFVKLNSGQAIGGRAPLAGTPEGLTDGFVPMSALGVGKFRLSDVLLNSLAEGLHVLTVRAFRDSAGGPGLYRDFKAFVFKRSTGAALQLDGDLTDLGPALVNQTRTPSSVSNRLDQMFVTNDDKNLYIGLAGNVDPNESMTNGVGLYMDLNPGTASRGTNNLWRFDDDSAPATRLLSHHAINASPGFLADVGLGIFRRTAAGTAAGYGWSGDPAMTPLTGAFAGLYGLNLGAPKAMTPMRMASAFQPRLDPFDPPKGWEIAIPLKELYPAASAATKINLFAYLGTTGEVGQTLSAASNLRGTWGGYGESKSWISNQFLPAQGSVVNDPGTAAASVSSYGIYTFKLATLLTNNISFTQSATTFDAANGYWNQTVTIKSFVAQNGPVYLRVTLPAGTTLENREGVSLRANAPYVLAAPNGIPSGGTVSVTLRYKSANGGFSRTYSAIRGPGAF